MALFLLPALLAQHLVGRRLGALVGDAQAFEHTASDALALADRPQQQMLGANVVMVEALRLLLRQRKRLAGTGVEFVEPIAVGGHTFVVRALASHDAME